MGRHGWSSVPNDDPLSIKLDIFPWNVQLTVMSPPVISSQDTNITLNNHHKLPLQSTTASFPVLHSSKLYLKQGRWFCSLELSLEAQSTWSFTHIQSLFPELQTSNIWMDKILSSELALFSYFSSFCIWSVVHCVLKHLKVFQPPTEPSTCDLHQWIGQWWL